MQLRALLPILMLALITACGGSSENTSNNNIHNQDDDSNNIACISSNQPVNWELALRANAEKLSEYNLFSNNCDPSSSHSERSLPYDLSAALFTDYASKYRLIFIPEGKQASYTEKEAFDFPVGSIITKTFSMPSNTSKRGITHETLLETRLLIKRETGWIARVYVWNKAGTEAYLEPAGKKIKIDKLKHKGEELSFTYEVPNQNACLTCHQFAPGQEEKTEKDRPIFLPIGPKARFLNSDYTYNTTPENQLIKWRDQGLLSGLPNKIEDIQKAHPFNDSMTLSDYASTLEELTATAKSWLDINCAHCHRPEGQASNTAFRADYNTPFTDRTYHGVCQKPVSGAAAGSTDIIVPRDPETSLLYNRLHTTEPGKTMPSLGRAVIHKEGTALIYQWISQMEGSGCRNS